MGLPKAIKDNRLKNGEINISKKVIQNIISFYTREAGVRKLQQEINKLCRKAVKAILSSKDINSIKILSSNLSNYLGVKRYNFGLSQKFDSIGQVTGLAWTEF